MIGKLRGIVDGTGEDWVVIDVSGVGYHVTCSSRTLAALPVAGSPVTLAIETYVREDQIRLFGFPDPGERDWFRLLLSVQGVGPRVALAVLGLYGADQLAINIAAQDKAAIARAPGIGPKVAQRIVSELKDKVPAFAAADPAIAMLRSVANDAGPGMRQGAMADAISALVNLGYGQAQANLAVATALRAGDDEPGTQELIRRGLKELAK